jgi:DNA-binding CsgD family transcriptional regulator
MLALAVLLGVVVLAFTYVAVRAFAYALRDRVPSNTRRLAIALGAVCTTFLLICLQALLHQAVLIGWLGDDLQEWLFTWGTSVLGAIAFVIAVVCLWLVADVFRRVDRAERLVSVMIKSPIVHVKVSDLGLTARELQVLELMAEGRLSDDEIAEAFFIAPTTAATHVKNILRKANLRNRRDLVLFYTAAKADAVT